MRRDLSRLADATFDLLLIGGGITGACIARDAAMRGLNVALVEKRDFAGATSAHNSKLIHGGLRYLRNLELGLVRESLRERRIWQRIAPHQVRPLPFLLPLYGAGAKARAALTAGLTLYDVLSFDRTWLGDPDQRLPRHRWLDKKQAAAQEPVLDGPDFEGAFLYYDAQMYSPERLALECLLDAVANGAAVANYVRADSLLMRNGKVEGATVRDVQGGETFDVRAKLVVITAGPWADIFLAEALGKPVSHKLLRSKGIHAIVPAVTQQHALTVAANGGHFFVLPWRGHALLGTTDTKFTGPPDDVGVTDADLEKFLEFINAHLPAAHLQRARVEHFYAGLRPLVDEGSGDTYQASRRAELIDHGKGDGVEGLFSAIGGKWTTSRNLAEKVTDAAVAKLGAKARRCATATTALPGGRIERVKEFTDAQRARYPEITSIDHLVRLYGAQLPAMLGEEPDGSAITPVGTSGDIAAQLLHASREEMALTLEDVILRRTGIGQLGKPSPEVIERCAAIMAAELGWTGERKAREIEQLAANYRLRPA